MVEASHPDATWRRSPTMTELATEHALRPCRPGRAGAPAGGPPPGADGYCYRMLGATFDDRRRGAGDDGSGLAGAAEFDGRSSLRTWLYRIATNVCLDLLNGRNRRALPMDFGPAVAAGRESLGEPRSEVTVDPADARRAGVAGDGGPGRAGRAEGHRSGWPSSPRCSTCHRVSGPCSSCARCCAGAPPRWPNCWTPRSPRSTARCSGPGPPSPRSTRRDEPTASTRWTTRRRTCWPTM